MTYMHVELIFSECNLNLDLSYWIQFFQSYHFISNMICTLAMMHYKCLCPKNKRYPDLDIVYMHFKFHVLYKLTKSKLNLIKSRLDMARFVKLFLWTCEYHEDINARRSIFELGPLSPGALSLSIYMYFSKTRCSEVTAQRTTDR